jgi:predicted histidine transporter YuiF (NhaC family)
LFWCFERQNNQQQKQQSTTKTTAHTTINTIYNKNKNTHNNQAGGAEYYWFTLGVFACLGWILFLFLASQQSTTKTTIYNKNNSTHNKNNHIQQQQKHTQQSSVWLPIVKIIVRQITELLQLASS